MLKKIISASAVTAALLLSGCGSNDAEAELEIAQLLDDGNYDAVISKLEAKANKTDTDYVALGSAYMGRSGLGMADLITVIADSTDASSDAFANFVNSVGDKKTSTTLADLKKSATAYYNVVDKTSCGTKDSNLSNTQKDICLYSGLSETMKAASTLSYLGDFESIINTDTPSVTEDDSLKASACAMKWAFDGTTTSANCVAVEDTNVTFENNATYTPLLVTMQDTGNQYDYLLTAPVAGVRQTALTDGYCTLTDFSTRADINYTVSNTPTYAGYYICPVNESVPEEELTAADLVVEALNGGLDSVINSLIPESDSSEDSDISADIEEFKGELLFADEDLPDNVTYVSTDNGTIQAVSNGTVVSEANATFTTEDIVNYLDSL